MFKLQLEQMQKTFFFSSCLAHSDQRYSGNSYSRPEKMNKLFSHFLVLSKFCFVYLTAWMSTCI